MPIVESTLITDVLQPDGSYDVHERHVDDRGHVHSVDYRAAAGTDIQAVMTARVSQLWSDIVAMETTLDVERIVSDGSQATLTFDYTTAANVRTALREKYRVANRLEAVMIGDFLNALSDAQLMAAFSLTQQQVTALRTNKLAPATNIATAVRAAAGS